jgi:hypothetical protein
MTTEPWHLSKTVPATLVFAISMQTIALIWFVSALNSSVESNRVSIIKLETRTETLSQIVQQQAITAARMDENIKAIRIAVEAMVVR